MGKYEAYDERRGRRWFRRSFLQRLEAAFFVALQPGVHTLATDAKPLRHFRDRKIISNDAEHGVVTLLHFAGLPQHGHLPWPTAKVSGDQVSRRSRRSVKQVSKFRKGGPEGPLSSRNRTNTLIWCAGRDLNPEPVD